MENHANLLLRLYGQARGRAAEYWGAAWLESDRWVWTNGIPGRARDWRARQGYYFGAWLDAFAAGINAYADAHRDRIADDVERVLPVTTDDVLAHVQRVIHFTFLASRDAMQGAAQSWSRTGGEPDAAGAELRAGSNAWAIAPSRAAGGHAMLLANPHLPWSDLYTWFETQLVLPAMSVYGAALVGFPTLGIAFNDALGWTHTVNTIDGADLYELTLQGNGYAFDRTTRAFESETVPLRVRQPDGSLRPEPLEIVRSVHGPLIARNGQRALALRVAGLDRPHLLEQTWDMMRANNLVEFEAALSRLQLPMFTVMYADREGHILHAFNGAVPVRSTGSWQYWSGVVPGNTSATLWDRVHEYTALPRVLDPATGWLQNANDPPWTTTFPAPLRPENYPAWMAPNLALAFRPQRSARLLANDSVISFDELAAYAADTHVELADHVLEDVALAAATHGGALAQRAAAVLAAWDRRTDATSRGAVLFESFWRGYLRQRGPNASPFDIPWQPAAPFATPDGIADPAAAATALEAAASQVEARYGSLDVAWGDAYRLRSGTVDLPAQGGPGGLGVFRVLGFSPGADGKAVATSGNTWIAAIEFARPVRAAVLLTYGNASQPGSPHQSDQLPLFARKALREAWRTRILIERHLARRDRF